MMWDMKGKWLLLDASSFIAYIVGQNSRLQDLQLSTGKRIRSNPDLLNGFTDAKVGFFFVALVSIDGFQFQSKK